MARNNFEENLGNPLKIHFYETASGASYTRRDYQIQGNSRWIKVRWEKSKGGKTERFNAGVAVSDEIAKEWKVNNRKMYPRPEDISGLLGTMSGIVHNKIGFGERGDYIYYVDSSGNFKKSSKITSVR